LESDTRKFAPLWRESTVNERRVAVISGASRGLGSALVEDFLVNGWTVAGFSRSESPFVEGCRERFPGRFWWRAANASEADAVQEFASETIGRFGRIDVLINNAGIGSDGILATMKTDRIQELVAVNLESVLLLTATCLKPMLAQEAGCVVSVSSVTGLRGHAGVVAYSATKAGIDGMTRSLAREVGPAGIRVNSVAPGYFESDMTSRMDEETRRRIIRRTPLGRLGVEADIVGTVRFLASPDAGFITGQTIVVDGGMTC
jgi:3-oxoacyl-[acyl-carrier protein] reductase